MTKDEIKAIIVPRLAARARAELTWGQVKDAVSAAGGAAKADVVAAIVAGNAKQAGALLIALTSAYLKTSAGTTADGLLADDNLSLAELEQVL
ncbi:MAG: hypothetical protein MUE59_06170 [Thiobacillaceae bacterium]|jgi:hypothetical protein|nr:hypothetical protein [Thiobacillaceae bacterium]